MKTSGDKLARLAFILYMFFVFFGATMPFQEKLGNAGDISTSNLFSQIIFSTIYLIAGIALFAKRKAFLRFIRKEKFLTLFLFWCLLTIAWSDFPVTSFKRWIQAIGPFVVFSAILLHIHSLDDALDDIKKILMVYLPLSLLAVIFIYEATQWEFPAWRGLAPSKNWLGQITLASVIVWSSLVHEKTLRKKMFAAIFLILSLLLLFGSKSTTSLLTLIFISGFALLLAIEKRLATLGVGRFLSFVLIGMLTLSLLTASWLQVDVKASFFDAIGKDATFTERIFLWQEIFNNAEKHLLAGGGFDGFWVPANETVYGLYKQFIWLPNQTHNGYLDMLNEIGLIGVGLFLLVLINYFFNLTKLKSPHFWKWFIVAVLILNLQESTLFRLNAVSGIMFMLAYLALFREISNSKSQIPNSNG